jgi:hypothetical protein
MARSGPEALAGVRAGAGSWGSARMRSGSRAGALTGVRARATAGRATGTGDRAWVLGRTRTEAPTGAMARRMLIALALARIGTGTDGLALVRTGDRA